MKLACFLAIAILGTTALFGTDTYFPKNTVSDFEQTWYAKHLSAMKEPVLVSRGDDKSHFAFRVLYLPTWGRPVAVRIEKTGEKIVRRSVILSGDGGYDPGRVKDEKESAITATEFATLLAEIRKSGFWELSPKDEVIGCDGSQLILEAIQDRKHVVFVRWTPEHDTAKRGLTGLVSLYSRLFQEATFWTKK
jgi:hypothetical protein